MAHHSKEIKWLQKIIHRYGLTLTQGRTHYRIGDQEGKRVGTMSGTPRDGNFAKNTLNQLIKDGYVPRAERPR